MRFIENIHSDTTLNGICPSCDSGNATYVNEKHDDENGLIKIEYKCDSCGMYFSIDELI